jgi:hypothetical protein
MNFEKPLRTSLALAALLSAACDKNKEPAQEQAQPTPAATNSGPSATAESASEPATPKATIWPDGYLVISEQEWIPVLDETGEKLQTARKDFVGGNQSKAASELRAAVSTIRDHEKKRKDLDKQELESSAKQLEGLAAQLEQHKAVTQEELDKVLTHAYSADAAISWLYLEEESWRPTFERPREHFARALDLLDKHDNAAAAAEIRRGTGFFQLAARNARQDDRALLTADIGRLNQAATRADQGKLTPPELKETLAQVDAAYAASYLHQAEERHQAKQDREASRELHEAAARMRARLQWLGKEAEHASSAIVDELDSVADKLAHGAKVASKEVTSLLRRAREQIQEAGDQSKKAKQPHG